MTPDIDLSDPRVAQALLRFNIYLFLQRAFTVLHPGRQLDKAEYVEAMCYLLQLMVKGECDRLIISIAPRHLKSICGSVIFPAFLLGHFPATKVMVVSYGGDLAREHATSFRRLITSRFYRELFPDTCIDPANRRAEHIRTTKGGGRQAVSLGGSVTGFGADVIVIDDLAKASEVHSPVIREQARTFFDETLYSRLDNKKSARILSIQQRLHQDDFTAYLLEKGTFEHLSLASIATKKEDIRLFDNCVWVRKPGDVLSPAREPNEVLDQIRQEIGDYAFEAQYQQNPIPSESALLSEQDLALVENLPKEEVITRRVQSWDMAAKDGPRCAWSVGMTFGWQDVERRWYLLDVIRVRKDYSDLRAIVLAARKNWRADLVIIEDAALGAAMLPDLQKTVVDVFGRVKVKTSKEARFIPATAWLKEGHIAIPADQPWFDTLRAELLAFPHASYDDQADALSQFVKWMRRNEETYLDRDPITGRRSGRRTPKRLRRRDRMTFE